MRNGRSFSIPTTTKIINSTNLSSAKPWVAKAIISEDKLPSSQLWTDEPSAEDEKQRRLREIRFLRKYVSHTPLVKGIINRLEFCRPKARCCSGACAECSRLIQRWFVRRLKSLVRDMPDQPAQERVAISIIPSRPIIRRGYLSTFSMVNSQRRLKYALKQTGIKVAVGGIDFSFNEDRKNKYTAFWCPHFYLITVASDRPRLSKLLKRFFPRTDRIPRPIKISSIGNSRRRLSYAYKTNFWRRIGFDDLKKKSNGTHRKYRNTSKDRLRATDRLELLIYLHQSGLEKRLVFQGIKPLIRSKSVRFQKL